MKLTGLYVDDLREAPKGWVLARTITEAISLLRITKWDYVSCDHDIAHIIGKTDNGLDIPFASPENFTPVIMYIAEMPSEIRPKVACHSANPNAHVKYSNILESVGDKLRRFTEYVLDD